jgi:UDP-2,3-diacylglucosamine pyrophosphatase LpxH
VKSAEETSGELKEPVIVVSDVHLGGEDSNFREFWNFLDWLTTLPADGKTLKCNATELTIKKPGTIVLLGDILELRDPRGDDRNYVAKDTLTPLSILNDLDCDIIYVIGNHDEYIFETRKHPSGANQL